MKKHLWFIGMIVALLAGQALAESPPPPPPPPPAMRVISVSGEAQEQVAPDQAFLSVSLVSKDPSLQEAKRHNDKLVEKLVGITRDFKIPKEKVATSGLFISPEYHYPQPGGRPELSGYTVHRSYRITMDDLSVHERLLSAIIDAKVSDQVGGVEFALAEPEAKSQAVRVKAFENARARAETLAKAAGAKLGPVISISTDGVRPPMPPMPMMAARMDMVAEKSVAPSLPGLITVSESVSVTFALEP